MNSIENNLSEILADAETAVLGVLGDAARAGDYAAIDRARVLAEKLRDLHRGLEQKESKTRTPVGGSVRQANSTKHRTNKRTAKKVGYPKFELKDGSLYKVGWSKKKNDEYVHRVPATAINLVSDALQQFAGSTEPVSSDQILESDLVKGKVPSYQVYVILAFLKDRGVITGVGREGFQLPSDITLQVNGIIREEAA